MGPATPHIYRIVYFSRALAAADIDFYAGIMRSYAAANAARHMTGCLLAHNGYLIQFLEGPENAVKTLYSKIYRDERHLGPTVLAEGLRAGRDFTGQSMNFETVTACNFDDYAFVIDALRLRRQQQAVSAQLSETLLGCFARRRAVMSA